MSKMISDQIIDRIAEAAGLYHRLVLVVAPSGAGKTAALRTVAEQTRAPLVNVNLELSRRLLDVPAKQRSPHLQRMLDQALGEVGGEVVLLDNTEILFDSSLQQDPLRLLQGLSRNRTVVASWNGSVENDCLSYAEAGHAEYRSYAIRGFLWVAPARVE